MNIIDDYINLIVEVDIFTFHSCVSVHLINNGSDLIVEAESSFGP